MLIKKENTKYGYKGRIRYDVKSPWIHVILPGEPCKIEGQADLTVITGTVSVSRVDNNKTIYDKLEPKDTYRIPEDKTVSIKATTKAVLIEDNTSADKVEQYLDLTVTEDEPSSDDLKYITED